MTATSVSTALFRPTCAACDGSLSEPRPLCAGCAQSLYPLGSACPRCALPIAGNRSIVCARCRRRPPLVAATTSPYRYGGELATALRRIKFSRRADLARSIAPLFAGALAGALADVDAAVVVPLHWRRLAARGFNQSERLYRHAAPRGGPPLVDALVRIRATAPQSALPSPRRQQVRGAFRVRRRARPRLRGRRLLLFDDIVTTGSTVEAAARALLDAGAAELVAFCVARVED